MRASQAPDTEQLFVESVRSMLARPDYLIPLVAAERQFRDHYYGLNSAALLEDLFFDALGTFIRQTQPRTLLTRPATGQKGWDYSFEGLRISHKVNQELGDIAALWDATKAGVTHWSFDEPILYVLGKNAPGAGLSLHLDGDRRPRKFRSLGDLKRPYLLEGRAAAIVRWPTDTTQLEVLQIVESSEGQTVNDVLPFSAVWDHIADQISSGGAANEIDVLVTNGRSVRDMVKYANSQDFPLKSSADIGLRGGAYLLKRDLLQDLVVTTNNRAILIPKDVVRDLLREAALHHLHAPLPLWYWPYAQQRPPDMYSAQRSEYEARFSARGDVDHPQ